MYPHLDKNQISIALDFDDICKEKWGEDYEHTDHTDELQEIFDVGNSDDTSEQSVAVDTAADTSDVGGESSDSETSA